MRTIFVDGGEYVDKATYIATRDTLSKLREIDNEIIRKLEEKVELLESDNKALHAHSSMLETRCDFWNDPTGSLYRTEISELQAKMTRSQEHYIKINNDLRRQLEELKGDER